MGFDLIFIRIVLLYSLFFEFCDEDVSGDVVSAFVSLMNFITLHTKEREREREIANDKNSF